MPFIEVPDRIPGLRAQARNNKPWYRITNQTADEAEVMLYDEVGGWLGATAESFIEELRYITAPKILLRLNSPGGVVTEGIAIANALRSHPAEVTVQVDGIAASIASVIAMAGDRVRMMPNSMIMVHEASGLCVGDAATMIKMAEVLDKISDNIAGAYAARAGGTETEWRQVMKEETWYRGEEAVAAGLADECMPLPKRGDKPGEAEPEMRRDFDLTAYGYRGPRRKETAKPQPAPAADGLTANIRSLVGEEVAAALRAAAAEPAPQPEPAANVPEVADTAVAPHNTAVEDGTWDAGANEKRLPSPVPVAAVKKMYAVYDEDQVEDGAVPKTAAKLPHHFVNDDGTPGAASVNAVRNALARLPQTEGLSDDERAEAERHLQAHLDAYNDGADNRTGTAPEARQQIVVQVHLDGREADVTGDLSDTATAVLLDALRARIPPASAPTSEPAAPAASGLAARTAHLKPAQPSPTWRDRVAHLTPPSSATTRTAR